MKSIAYIAYSLIHEFNFNIFSFFKNLLWYLGDLKNFVQTNDKAKIKLLMPSLKDKTANTNIEPIYFYQDAWVAHKIFSSKPIKHVDVGSSVKTMGLISQHTPISFVDIRPPDVHLQGLDFIKGTILHLPFRSGSVLSLSSICVVEHIGLGRYGDDIDPYGSEKAVAELLRVLNNGGNLYITVPVDRHNATYFNSHRVFTRNYFLRMFSECTLVEEKYIYGRKVFPKYSKRKGFGTALFHFKKK